MMVFLFFILPLLTRVSNMKGKIFYNNTLMQTIEIQDMEHRILEAAKQVFVRKGYDATKMGDIAAEVGISRTALHYYFRTKELLFNAIFGQLMDALLPNIRVIVEKPTSCLEKIPEIVEQYLSLLHAHPSFPIFVVNELNRDPEHLYQVILQTPSRFEPLMQLQTLLQEEMESGKLKKMPLVYVVSTFFSLMVFPLLMRNALTRVFLDDDSRKFECFLQERKVYIVDILVRMLQPE